MIEYGDLTRRLDFETGHHGGRKGDDVKNYGVGGMRMRFSLIGPRGAAQLLMGTGWYLPETWKWWEDTGRLAAARTNQPPDGHCIALHGIEPFEHGGIGEKDTCELLPGGFCYWDVSYSASDEVVERFLREGEEGVWAALKDWYDETWPARLYSTSQLSSERGFSS